LNRLRKTTKQQPNLITLNSPESGNDEPINDNTPKLEDHNHIAEKQDQIIKQDVNSSSPIKTPLTDITNHLLSQKRKLTTPYSTFGEKIAKAAIFFDIGGQGLETLKKTLSQEVIGTIFTSIQNRIEKTRQLIPEPWLKSRVKKKLPLNKKSYFLNVFNYFNHYTLFYHLCHVNPQTKIISRPRLQQEKGIFEDVSSYSKRRF